MHVIIEGIDKVGKSTLARELSKKLYYPVVNRLKPKSNIFIECIDFLTDTNESMIVDRFHLSELAYGPVKRNKIRFDFRELSLIEMSMLSLNTFNIYCYNDIDFIEKKFKEDKESFLTKEDIKPVLKLFEKSLNKISILKWHKYKIGDDIDEIAEKIKKSFESYDKEKIEMFKKYRTVGNFDSEVIIYGEKYGDKLLPPLIPFGNNYPGLGLFLSLNKSKFKLNKILISNVFKHGLSEKENEEALFKELNLKNIKLAICLGDSAYYYLESKIKKLNKNIYIEKIYHPSYVFAYNKLTGKHYIELLNKIYDKYFKR